MEDIVIEIKNNLQGNKSSVDEAKNQINDSEHKEKNKTIKTTSRKETKKMRIV